MSKNRAIKSVENSGSIVRFKIGGLIVFSVSLILVSAMLTYALAAFHSNGLNLDNKPRLPGDPGSASQIASKPPATIPPWGELFTHDINIERPEEYVGFEVNTDKVPDLGLRGNAAERSPRGNGFVRVDAQPNRARPLA